VVKNSGGDKVFRNKLKVEKGDESWKEFFKQGYSVVKESDSQDKEVTLHFIMMLVLQNAERVRSVKGDGIYLQFFDSKTNLEAQESKAGSLLSLLKIKPEDLEDWLYSELMFRRDNTPLSFTAIFGLKDISNLTTSDPLIHELFPSLTESY
jgi:hypothetical protein